MTVQEGAEDEIAMSVLWALKFSHKAQIFPVDFRDMKELALCSACVEKKKNTNHSNNFSAGTGVFFFIFVKLTQENAKWFLLNLNIFKCTNLEILHQGL